MKLSQMNLKVLLPFRIFLEADNVVRIVVETNGGSLGLLPNRLDFTAALVPGILTYETTMGAIRYLALDEGIMVKTNEQVFVSVRNAIGGTDLGKMRAAVEKEFSNIEEKERTAQVILAKLESGFIRSLEKFHKE